MRHFFEHVPSVIAKVCLVIATLAWLCPATHADDRTQRFYHLSTKNGLSDNAVFHIYQDRTGFLWFCTQNGLNRYDGYRFTHYHNDNHNPNSLSNNNISMVCGDLDGGLWLATWGGGLNYLHPTRNEVRHYQPQPGNPHSLPDAFVQTLYNPRGNTLWLGMRRDGLVAFDKQQKRFTRVEIFPEEVASKRIWSMAPDYEGRLWLATDHGLRIIDLADRSIQPTPQPACAPFDLTQIQVRTLFLDQNQNWWLGTAAGLLRFNADTNHCDYYPLDPGEQRPETADQINVVLEDRGGTIWVGTKMGGLYRYHQERNQFTNYRQNPRLLFSLNGDDIRHLFEDQSGNLWIATRTGGVGKLNLKPPKFRKVIHQPGRDHSLQPGLVNAVDSDQQGHIWFGMETGGLTRYNRDNDHFDHLQHQPKTPNSLSHNEVLALAHDHEQVLWVGTKRGLNRMTAWNHFDVFPPNPEYPEQGPLGEEITELSAFEQEMWIGSPAGLSVYKAGRFHHFNGALSQAGINQIAFARDGTAWLATGTQGVVQFDRKRFAPVRFFQSNPNDFDSIPSNEVLCLLPKNHRVWLGAYGGGLSVLTPSTGSVQRFEVRAGLAGNIVWGILDDNQGCLWLSTSRGLSRFNIEDETFLNYDTFDGLQSDVFSRGAYHRTAWGELVFGGVDGANLFFPDRIRTYAFEPPLAITAVAAMGSPVAPFRADNKPLQLVMDRYDNVLTLNYTAFDFTQPERNRYRYRLLEQPSGQTIATSEAERTGETRAFATFQDLRPGRYQFELYGAGHEGTWVSKPLLFHFEIQPPFHQGWWIKPALVLLFVAMAGLAVHYFRLRERQRAKLELLTQSERLAVDANQTKSAFLAHMSHELRTPLNHIIGYSELIEEDIDELSPDELDFTQIGSDLAKIRAAALYQLTLVNNILELTRIESGRSELYCEWFLLDKIIQNITSQMQPMLEKTGNRLDVSVADGALDMIHGDQAKVQSLLLNVLTNANKFTDQGTIWFRIHRDQKRLVFTVEDTGIGMSEAQTQKLFRAFSQMVDHNQYGGTGLGLHICNYFCRLMNGYIEVESEKGRGSTFRIHLPVICGEPETPMPTETTNLAAAGTSA